MSKPLLSICIPTYNRADLLRVALMSVVPQLKGLGNSVELIVSDNNSNDHTREVVEWARQYGRIKYSVNSSNVGVTKNIFKITNDLATGEFCWIIGDDDFIMPDAVEKIIKVLECSTDLDYFFAVESNIQTGIVSDLQKDNILLNSNNFYNIAVRYNNDYESRYVDRFEQLIDPKIRFDYLGYISNSIFRIKLWNSVDISNVIQNCFSDWVSTYPHIYILGKSFFGKKAYYSGETLLICGDGARDWQSNDFWSGYLPVIYFRYFDDILNHYRKCGLCSEHYKKCRYAYAQLISVYLEKYFIAKYVNKINIPASEQIRLKSIVGCLKFYSFRKVFISAIKGFFISYFGRFKTFLFYYDKKNKTT